MKQTPLTIAIQEVVDLKMRVVDEFLKDIIEPIGDVGNPEKLIGKPYEQWTTADFQALGQIYGKEPNPLSELIFKKSYERVRKLEEE